MKKIIALVICALVLLIGIATLITAAIWDGLRPFAYNMDSLIMLMFMLGGFSVFAGITGFIIVSVEMEFRRY